MKQCTKCGEEKPIEDFRKAKGYRGGRQSRCKACEAAALKEWRERNPQKLKEQTKRRYEKAKEINPEFWRTEAEFERRRNGFLKRKYGITLDDYARMLEEQDGRCAACGTDEHTLVVDHCHGTGKVRKLLCGNCNTIIGMAGESGDTLRRIAEHVDSFTDR